MGKPGKPGKPKNPEGRLFDNALLSNLLFGTVATSTKYSMKELLDDHETLSPSQVQMYT
jgi:hypothetical protein